MNIFYFEWLSLYIKQKHVQMIFFISLGIWYWSNQLIPFKKYLVFIDRIGRVTPGCDLENIFIKPIS